MQHRIIAELEALLLTTQDQLAVAEAAVAQLRRLLESVRPATPARGDVPPEPVDFHRILYYPESAAASETQARGETETMASPQAAKQTAEPIPSGPSEGGATGTWSTKARRNGRRQGA
jgi:hypothetical protein